MTLTDLLSRLDPLQQRVVSLIYMEGRSAAETARTLAIDRGAVGVALANASRPIARWAVEDDETITTFPPVPAPVVRVIR